MTRYSGSVYAACLRILANPSEAEDVAQECFVRLAERRADIRTSLAGWLHRVATRRAVDAYRSAERAGYERSITRKRPSALYRAQT